MEKDTQQFNDVADKLRAELSLMSEEEYMNEVLKEDSDFDQRMDAALKKKHDQFVFNEVELKFLDGMKFYLPQAFWEEHGLDEYYHDDMHLAILSEENPMAAQDVIKELIKGGCKRADAEPEQENFKPIEEILDALHEGVVNGAYSDELRRRFHGQSNVCKIEIIRTLLATKEFDFGWCSWVLAEEWWDDVLIPDVIKVWKVFPDGGWANVITRRFPYEYVKEHQKELGMYYYEGVCTRLAKDKDFTINKQRLTRRDYLWIQANNRIHIKKAEADKLLFDYVILSLRKENQLLNEGKEAEWWRYVDVDSVKPDNYHYFTRLFNCKPTLLLLPWVANYASALCITGNMATVAKLINWNRFLQSNVPSFMEEKGGEAMCLEQIEEPFNEHMDKSWRRFVELAIRTCPIDSDGEYEFCVDDDGSFS